MHLVSAKVARIIAESVSILKGIPADSLFENSPIQLADTDKKNQWMAWETLVDWVYWLDKQPYGPLDWELIGKTGPDTSAFAYAKAIVRASISVRYAYYIGAKWLGNSLFPSIASKVEYVGKHDVRETLVLASTAKECPQLFKLFIGALTVLPEQSFGLARAKVTLRAEGRTFIYDIKVPEQHTLWSRFVSFLRASFSYKRILLELENQQQQLQEKSQLIFNEREELKNFIKLFPDGVFIYRDGKIRYANEKVATYLNLELSEIVGKEIFPFVHPSSHELIKSRVAELSKNPGLINPHLEFSMLRKGSAEPVVVECTSITTIFEGERSVLVVMRDLTERKKMQMKMMKNDRLISLGQLAAGVGHEINNPLTSILLKLELLQESKQPLESAEAAKILSEIKDGLERIKYITNDLKTLARNRDEDLLSNLDVNRILKSTIHMTRNEIEHRARLVFEPGEVKQVYANEARLSQVFLNILINAIQAIEPGHADENEISIRTKQVNKQVVIEFSDTGCGVPEEMKDRLFQPFQTTKIGQGTGLGLSICESIVRKYNGAIEFDSTLGQGSLFRVVLPVSEVVESVMPVQTEAAKSKPVNMSKTGYRVLIVDDDKEVLGMFHSIVARKFEVSSYSDSREALKALQAGEKFDCIVCDLMMPNIGGMEFYQKLKEISPDQQNKIIFVTGGSFTSVTDQFLRTPGLLFIEKPVSFKDLLKAIENLIQAG